jgi:ribonuclease HI
MPNWVRRGWKTSGGDPVKNRDLWERLNVAAASHKVDWRWVKGHSGDPDNERVDQLARVEAVKIKEQAS